MLGVLEVEPAVARVGRAVAAGPGRHDAVEHVDAAPDRLDDVVGRADSHEVARLVARQMRLRRLDHPQHDVLRLPDGEAADRVTLEVERHELARALDAQALDGAPLNDAEQRPPRLLTEGDAAALGPPQAQTHRLLYEVVGGRQPHALVKLHLDVGAEQALDLDRPFRGEHMRRAVDVRLEGDPALVELAQGRERHDLEAARVRQDRERPVHERVQAPEPRDALGSRAQHEVVSVAEDDVGTQRLHLLRVHGLDRRGGADGHERRGADYSARHADLAAARRSVRARHIESEAFGHRSALERRRLACNLARALPFVACGRAGPRNEEDVVASSSDDRVVYAPIDVLKPAAEDLFIVDSGPLRIMGLPLPVRMTVIRLANGDVLMHSPTRFDARLKAEIEAIGPIRHLVAPNIAHWSFLQDWQRECPQATTWAAPGLRQRSQVKASGVRLDRDLPDASPPEWAGDIDQAIIPGAAGFREVAFFHRPSRTLVLTDLIVNLEPGKLPLAARAFAWATGTLAPDGKAPAYLRLVVKRRRAAARTAVGELVALAPGRGIFSHGLWFDRDGAAQLRRSLSWLLD